MKNHSQMSPGAALGLHLGSKNDEKLDAKILVDFDAILGDFGAPFGSQKLTKMVKNDAENHVNFHPILNRLFSLFFQILITFWKQKDTKLGSKTAKKRGSC